MAYAATSNLRGRAPVIVPQYNPNAMDRDNSSPRTPATNEAPKSTKRKGTRSVSTLTPAQLARKRANDREAQRAIRARTKEHIDRLERENEELKKAQNADTRVQHFLRKIEMLETENKNLRTQAAQHGLPVPSSDPYSSDGLQSMHSAAINGRSNPYGHTVRASSDPYTNGYTHLTTPHGMPTPEATEPWQAPAQVSMASSVSSPASCAAEDYRFMSTSVSAPMIDTVSVAPTSVPFHSNQEVEYESGVDSEHSFHHSHHHHHHQQSSSHHSTPVSQLYAMPQSHHWNTYPHSSVYSTGYPHSPSM